MEELEKYKKAWDILYDYTELDSVCPPYHKFWIGDCKKYECKKCWQAYIFSKVENEKKFNEEE